MKKINLAFLLFLVFLLGLQDGLTKATTSHRPITDLQSTTEINLIADLLSENDAATKDLSFEKKFEDVFTEALGHNWKHSKILLEFARLTANNRLKFIIYTILWQEIKTTSLLSNPFAISSVYENLQNDLKNLKVPLFPAEEEKFANLQQEIHGPLTTACAKKLEAAFYVNGSGNNCKFPILERLLIQMQPLGEVMFEETLDKLFEAIEDLVTPDQIIKTLVKFTPDAKQSVVAMLKFINRTSIGDDSSLMDSLKLNIQLLAFKSDFRTIPEQLQQQIDYFLPQKNNLLDTATKVCFRNDTRYLKYCCSSYFCTALPEVPYHKFEVKHAEDGTIAFLNVYSDQYIFLNENEDDSNINLNLQPSSTPSYWHIQSNFNNTISLLDSSKNYYMCSGNPRYLDTDGDSKVYARRFEDWVQYRNECSYTIEECD